LPVVAAPPIVVPPPLPVVAGPPAVVPPPLPVMAAPIYPDAAAHSHVDRDAELPDFLDGPARRRRVALIVASIAVLALVATTIAAVASHFQPQ
jgi:hypothetical protein